MNLSLPTLPPRLSALASAASAALLLSALCTPSAEAVPSRLAVEGRHALWIDQGNVHGVGSNAYCSTVYTTAYDLFKPAPIFTGDRKAVSVAVAGLQSAILFADGTALFRGSSSAPESTRHCHQAPVPMGDITDIALTTGGGFNGVFFISKGQVYRWTGVPGDAPVALAGGAGARSVAGGNGHVVVLFCDGTVATLGRSAEGQLGRELPAGATIAYFDELVRLPLQGVESATASAHSTLLRMLDGRTMMFGAMSGAVAGLTGIGGFRQRTPTVVDGIPADTIKLRSVGGSTLYALTSTGKVHVRGWHRDLLGRDLDTYRFIEMPYPAVKDLATNESGNGALFDTGTPAQRQAALGTSIYDVKASGTLLDPASGVHVLDRFDFSPMPASSTLDDDPALAARTCPAPVVEEPPPVAVQLPPEPSPVDAPAVVAAVEPQPELMPIGSGTHAPPSGPDVPDSQSALDTVLETISSAVDSVVEAVATVVDVVVEAVAGAVDTVIAAASPEPSAPTPAPTSEPLAAPAPAPAPATEPAPAPTPETAPVSAPEPAPAPAPAPAPVDSAGKVKEAKANNGFGNGDQAAPGNSLTHNRAENSTRSAVASSPASKDRQDRAAVQTGTRQQGKAS